MEELEVMEVEKTPNAPPAGKQKRQRLQGLFAPGTVKPALKQALVMLRPDVQWKNPVMFVVEIGAFLTLLFVIRAAMGHADSMVPVGYSVSLDVWLWLTVLFANFATALAESRGKAQAQSLRRMRRETLARRQTVLGTVEKVASNLLKTGDTVVVSAGEVIPGDGEIIQGIASVDESAITGESAPVIR